MSHWQYSTEGNICHTGTIAQEAIYVILAIQHRRQYMSYWHYSTGSNICHTGNTAQKAIYVTLVLEYLFILSILEQGLH